MRTNSLRTLAVRCTSFPEFTPHAIPHGQLGTRVCAHRTAGATGVWYCRRCHRRRHSFNGRAASAATTTAAAVAACDQCANQAGKQPRLVSNQAGKQLDVYWSPLKKSDMPTPNERERLHYPHLATTIS